MTEQELEDAAKRLFMAEFSEGHGVEFMEKMWELVLTAPHLTADPPCEFPMTCDACIREEFFEKAICSAPA